MQLQIGTVQLHISFYFFVVICTFLALDRTGITGLMLLGILLHELGHIAAMAFCRVSICTVDISPLGLRITRKGGRLLPARAEIAIALSGCLVNFIIAGVFYLLAGQVSRAVTISAVHMALGLFNLLPVTGLDGGKALNDLLHAIMPPTIAWWGCRLAAVVALGALFIFSGLMVLQSPANLPLLFLCIYLSLCSFKG